MLEGTILRHRTALKERPFRAATQLVGVVDRQRLTGLISLAAERPDPLEAIVPRSRGLASSAAVNQLPILDERVLELSLTCRRECSATPAAYESGTLNLTSSWLSS